MPATIPIEYTRPTDGVKATSSLRVDVVKRRADKNPDGSDNTTLAESVFLQISGPAGAEDYLRHIDGHILDGLLGVIGATPSNANADNGGTPLDQLSMDGVCGIISQLERPAIPTNVVAAYTAEVTAGTVVTPDVGNTGDDTLGAAGTPVTDQDWDVVVTTGGAFDGATAQVTVYETGTTNVVHGPYAPTSGIGEVIGASGVTLTLTDGGDTVLTLNDKWLVENTQAVAEGILLTWTDSPDVVATFYKVVALSGVNFDVETVVDETDTGVAGSLVASGVQMLSITSLNSPAGTYKFAVYATTATAASGSGSLEGEYNQSLRSVPSNTINVL